MSSGDKDPLCHLIGKTFSKLDILGAPTITSVSDAVRMPSGRIKVRGVITSQTDVYQMTTATILTCNNCGNKEANQYKIPLVTPDRRLQHNRRCPNCNTDLETSFEYTSALCIELQDLDKFSEIERLPVLLFGENTKNVGIGEQVTIRGENHVIQNRAKGKSFTYLYADSIKYEQREELILTDQDIEAIERFRKKNRSKLIKKLVSMFAPSIIGYDHIKQGLLLSAVNSGFDEGVNNKRKRSRINVLLIGEPGLAKSRLLLETTKLIPNSRYESGQNSSGKSLTAIIEKEDERHILRLGPVSLAKGAICAINELGRMSFEHQAHLLDVMEEGEFSINKYGINRSIRAPTTILASANPVNSAWKNSDKIDLDEIPALKPIIDRFDLVFGLRRLEKEQAIREYAYKKSELEGRLEPDYNAYLKKHIMYARRTNPILTEEAKEMLNEYYIELATIHCVSPRVQETLFRLAKAIARLKLKNIVNIDDARETMQFYNAIMLQYQQVVKIPENPKDVTCSECIDVLKQSRVAISFEDLLSKVCQKNEQIKSYLGNDLRTRKNWKIRALHKMLLNHTSIKQVQEKPIVLQWIEDTKSMKGDSIPQGVKSRQEIQCDVCDVCEDESSITKNRFPIELYQAKVTHIVPLLSRGEDSVVIVDRTVLSVEEQTLFLERFEELAGKNKEKIVNHKELKSMLVSSGKFFVGEAQFAIEQMLKSGEILEVSFHKYRRGETIKAVAVNKSSPIRS